MVPRKKSEFTVLPPDLFEGLSGESGREEVFGSRHQSFGKWSSQSGLSCSRSADTLDVQSPDVASASLRVRLLWCHMFRLAIDMFAILGPCDSLFFNPLKKYSFSSHNSLARVRLVSLPIIGRS